MSEMEIMWETRNIPLRAGKQNREKWNGERRRERGVKEELRIKEERRDAKSEKMQAIGKVQIE